MLPLCSRPLGHAGLLADAHPGGRVRGHVVSGPGSEPPSPPGARGRASRLCAGVRGRRPGGAVVEERGRRRRAEIRRGSPPGWSESGGERRPATCRQEAREPEQHTLVQQVRRTVEASVQHLDSLRMSEC